MYSTDNNNVQYDNVQYTCNNKNKPLSLFFILNYFKLGKSKVILINDKNQNMSIRIYR